MPTYASSTSYRSLPAGRNGRGCRDDRHLADSPPDRADRGDHHRAPDLVLLLPDPLWDDAERGSADGRLARPAGRRDGRGRVRIRRRAATRFGAAPDAWSLIAGPARRRLPGGPLPRGGGSVQLADPTTSGGGVDDRRRGRVRRDP